MKCLMINDIDVIRRYISHHGEMDIFCRILSQCHSAIEEVIQWLLNQHEITQKVEVCKICEEFTFSMSFLECAY